MANDFIKVEVNDSRNKKVNVKGIEPVNNIKIIRDHESDVSDDLSSLSSESTIVKKKTKKVLRKKERFDENKRDYGAFSNPKKISRSETSYSESEYSDITESEEAGSEYSYTERKEKESWEEKQKIKQDLLIKIQALEKKGFEFSKKFNMTSSYEEMEFEYSKIKKFIESQAGIKFARRCLMACVTGIEFLNKKFDPFNIKLEGWSENVMESVDDYDNIFEKLHEKYSSKAEIMPEIELLLTLGGSAFMFHLTNSLLKSPAMSNIPVAQNNPNFLQSMMGAMSQGMKEAAKPPNFKQNNQENVPQKPPIPMETRGVRKEMRGPNLDPNLFNGTPLASNHPSQMNTYPKPPMPQQNFYYDPNPIDDEDRFSSASSDSSMSSISVRNNTRTLNIGSRKVKGGKHGLELHIN